LAAGRWDRRKIGARLVSPTNEHCLGFVSLGAGDDPAEGTRRRQTELQECSEITL